MIPSLLAGLVAGAVHVLAGPDHLAAVAPLAVRGRRRAWVRGAQWGLGHAVAVAVLAGLALLFREALPLERISGYSERVVGVVLIGIGLWTLRAALRRRIHAHEHEHDGSRHVHVHVHDADGAHADDHGGDHDHGHAPLWIGVLHGAAGTAHLFAVLPALALPTRAEAAAYLAGYGLGTVGAMVAFAAAVGALSGRARGPRTYRNLLGAAGAVAVAVGVFWLVPR